MQGIYNTFAFSRHLHQPQDSPCQRPTEQCSLTHTGRAGGAEHKEGQGDNLTEITNLRSLNMWKLCSLTELCTLYILVNKES